LSGEAKGSKPIRISKATPGQCKRRGSGKEKLRVIRNRRNWGEHQWGGSGGIKTRQNKKGSKTGEGSGGRGECCTATINQGQQGIRIVYNVEKKKWTPMGGAEWGEGKKASIRTRKRTKQRKKKSQRSIHLSRENLERSRKLQKRRATRDGSAGQRDRNQRSYPPGFSKKGIKEKKEKGVKKKKNFSPSF